MRLARSQAEWKACSAARSDASGRYGLGSMVKFACPSRSDQASWSKMHGTGDGVSLFVLDTVARRSEETEPLALKGGVVKIRAADNSGDTSGPALGDCSGDGWSEYVWEWWGAESVRSGGRSGVVAMDRSRSRLLPAKACEFSRGEGRAMLSVLS